MLKWKRKTAALAFESRDAEFQYIISMRGVKTAVIVGKECGISCRYVRFIWEKHCINRHDLRVAAPHAKKKKEVGYKRKRVMGAKASVSRAEKKPSAKKTAPAAPLPFNAGDLLKAQTRLKAIKLRAAKLKEAKLKALKLKKSRPIEPAPLPETAVLLHNLEKDMCHFPLWDDDAEFYNERFYCGAPVVEGRIYCAECLKKMYTTARKPSEAKRPFVIKESRYAA